MHGTRVTPGGYLLITFAVCVTPSGSQGTAKRIDCDTDALASNCDFGHVCWVTCPEICPLDLKLYGTETYTYDSAICVAAIHDLRLSPWNRTHRTVAFQRNEDAGSYRGSWRNGVKTYSYGSLRTYRGSYRFVSQRIQEPLLDLTSVHVRYRFERNGNHAQVCFAPPGQVIDFTHFGWNTRQYDGTLAYDVYFPTTLSQTISVNEDVNIGNANGGGSINWFKDGDGVANRQSTIRIRNAQLGDGGLYAFRQPPGPMQVSRVIVRACPGGRYGDGCRSICPQCLHGGVCHDITGVCVCPPGFTGDRCEVFCNLNHFGKNCSHNCTEVSALAGGDPRCRGMLFCLPDPYGCSCYPGFRGLDCTETCADGTFGAGCQQKRTCHCQHGVGCHPQWGVCAGGTCEEGYRDEPYCEREYPVLNTFNAKVIDEESINVYWEPWSSLKGDKGEGEPDGYVIQFKEREATTWNRTDIIPDSGNGTLSFDITDLKPNTWYNVQVLVHDVSGHVHSQTARIASVRTPCGAPLSAPHNVKYEEGTDGTVKVKWQLPERSEWQCDVVSAQVQVNDGAPQHSNSFGFTFSTRHFTAYRIQVRLATIPEKAGPWSDPFEFTTREEAPGEVSSLSNERLLPKTYRLRWQPPAVANGILREYHLLILARGLDSVACPEFQAPERINASFPANVTSTVLHNLTASTVYSVSILATTVKDGPWKDYRLITKEEVPEGAPQRLTVDRIANRSAAASWQAPDCRSVNGPITSYVVLLTSPEEWAADELSRRQAESTVEMSGLVPFTEYKLSVSAENSVGMGPAANVTFKTAPSVPPPPSNLTVYSASSQHLALSWNPPYPPHGVLERYVVHYKLARDSVFQDGVDLTPDQATCGGDADSRSGQHCAVLGALLPKMEYHVFVVAKNKDVRTWSERSNLVTAQTRESKPGPPSHVSAGERNESAVIITWKEPSLPNGIILGYRVTLVNRQLQSTENNMSIEVPADGRQAQFIDLTPGTGYVAQVEARTAAGYGTPMEITIHTRPRLPVIGTKVELRTVDETAITLQLSRANDEPDDIKAYYVLVQRHDQARNRSRRSTHGSKSGDSGGGGLHEWTEGTPDYNESLATNLSFYMAAKMTPEEVRSRGDFTVGDGLYYGGYYNAPLVPESTYSVGLAAEVDFEGDTRISYRLLSEPVTVRKQQPVGRGSTPIAVIVIVVILMVVLIVAAWKWRKKIIGRLPRTFPHKPATPASDAASLSIVEESDGLEFEMEEIGNGNGTETSSKPLPVSDLQDYVQRMLACDGLKSEFIRQPKGRQYPTIEAQRTENKVKNRYGNLLAYDHSRVRLKPIPGVSFSDYINASYIDGYCRPKRYIATQGPKPHTVDDFWRMVWQENVCKVVMLTGLVENGKTKCEKYWPEKTATYGDVQVHFITEETFPEYTIHQLHITLADTTREVKHFHLTSWPDHGVPLYPNALLTFRKKVNQYRTFNEAPVVVHCSAGVGRTGAYILLENLIEQAQSEGVVDVIGQLAAMRHNRMNVVETLEQYNFVHRALMESVCIRDHSVPCSKISDRYRELLAVDESTGKNNFAKEFEELKSLKPWFTPADFTTATDPANLRKSRDTSVLAADRCRPLLRDGTFVNAVYVNGFHKKDKFLVTQTPSSRDVDDFWKLVVESGTRTIVTLDVFSDDADVVQFWPTSGSARYGDHKVECTENRNVNDMSVQALKVTPKHKGPGSSGAVTVRHFHRNTWNSAEQMVDLVDHVERWQQQSDDKLILVQCRNGCFASGLFCCSLLVLEKLKDEQEVDVFYATRIVRENRPQFILDSDQYKFCYDVAMAYLESFEMYANFRQ
ncbi:receptor-type tyrosine-protein phosphatase kappa-like isoform X2 [Dermacentor variabilis]|uniref:receptor-type tyrosine-protein phosphatase kappa-like isoform X2 n=1 Tax=Dermacentor variabilis TaxID=34621 RepID=UPI003F5B0F6C